MNALTTILMTAGAVLLPLLAQAQGIGRIYTDNNSSANESHEIFGGFEFQSWATFTSPGLDGRSASFTHRMAWYGGLLTEGGNPLITLAGVESFSVAYLLHFTVFDPGAVGYTLQVQSQLGGVLYARDDEASLAQVRLDAFSVSVEDGRSPGGSFVDLPGLATARQSFTGSATPADGLHPVNEQGHARVGDYVGTRDFVLAVAGGPQVLENLSSGGQAQGHLQFGRPPALTILQDGLYTGPGGRSLNDLGHFLNVAVEYAPAPAVPEPGSWALMAAGLCLLLARQGCGMRSQCAAS